MFRKIRIIPLLTVSTVALASSGIIQSSALKEAVIVKDQDQANKKGFTIVSENNRALISDILWLQQDNLQIDLMEALSRLPVSFDIVDYNFGSDGNGAFFALENRLKPERRVFPAHHGSVDEDGRPSQDARSDYIVVDKLLTSFRARLSSENYGVDDIPKLDTLRVGIESEYGEVVTRISRVSSHKEAIEQAERDRDEDEQKDLDENIKGKFAEFSIEPSDKDEDGFDKDPSKKMDYGQFGKVSEKVWNGFIKIFSLGADKLSEKFAQVADKIADEEITNIFFTDTYAAFNLKNQLFYTNAKNILRLLDQGDTLLISRFFHWPRPTIGASKDLISGEVRWVAKTVKDRMITREEGNSVLVTLRRIDFKGHNLSLSLEADAGIVSYDFYKWRKNSKDFEEVTMQVRYNLDEPQAREAFDALFSRFNSSFDPTKELLKWPESSVKKVASAFIPSGEMRELSNSLELGFLKGKTYDNTQEYLRCYNYPDNNTCDYHALSEKNGRQTFRFTNSKRQESRGFSAFVNVNEEDHSILSGLNMHFWFESTNRKTDLYTATRSDLGYIRMLLGVDRLDIYNTNPQMKKIKQALNQLEEDIHLEYKKYKGLEKLFRRHAGESLFTSDILFDGRFTSQIFNHTEEEMKDKIVSVLAPSRSWNHLMQLKFSRENCSPTDRGGLRGPVEIEANTLQLIGIDNNRGFECRELAQLAKRLLYSFKKMRYANSTERLKRVFGAYTAEERRAFYSLFALLMADDLAGALEEGSVAIKLKGVTRRSLFEIKTPAYDELSKIGFEKYENHIDLSDRIRLSTNRVYEFVPFIKTGSGKDPAVFITVLSALSQTANGQKLKFVGQLNKYRALRKDKKLADIIQVLPEPTEVIFKKQRAYAYTVKLDGESLKKAGVAPGEDYTIRFMFRDSETDINLSRVHELKFTLP